MINLTINVKDSNGNPVSGANVRVYDGNTLVDSGVTDGSGKAVVQVPEAKEYRIVIDGNGINRRLRHHHR
jgi:Bacterial Ig-like domain (group 1).